MQLGEKHYRCIEMIIEGNKITEIAKLLGASRQSIYNWLDDDVFKAELNKQRQEIKKQGQDKILSKFDIYLNKIHDIALNSPSDNVKLNALEFLVEHVLGKATSKIEQTTKEETKNNKQEDIDDLLKELEEDHIIIKKPNSKAI